MGFVERAQSKVLAEVRTSPHVLELAGEGLGAVTDIVIAGIMTGMLGTLAMDLLDHLAAPTGAILKPFFPRLPATFSMDWVLRLGSHSCGTKEAE
jgi:hypothetical protein